jgi:dephospho-CoA kinase
MIVVGLTGGIGSGKTTVLKMFQDLGMDCYVSDVEAKKFMNSSKTIRRKIVEAFGEDSYSSEGLNRAYLAKIVFLNPEKLNILNSIVHPKVYTHFKKFVKKAKSAYVIYESAILFENNGYENCDFVITVVAPVELRIQRIIDRDNSTKEDILNRMKNQFSDKEKIEKSDFIIENIDLKNTKKEVDKLHMQFLLNGVEI